MNASLFSDDDFLPVSRKVSPKPSKENGSGNSTETTSSLQPRNPPIQRTIKNAYILIKTAINVNNIMPSKYFLIVTCRLPGKKSLRIVLSGIPYQISVNDISGLSHPNSIGSISYCSTSK